MSLPKIDLRSLLIIFLIFSNFWIYRIFKLDFIVGLTVVITTLIICLFWNSKKSFLISLLCILVLLFFQYKTTNSQSLTILNNDEQRVQSERMLSYGPTYIDLYFKVIWLKPAEWIEKNNLVIALSRIEKNLFENLNLNKFFFGGFPGNKPEDFEKFTFFLMPFFILGLLKITKEKKIKQLGVLFLLPLVLLMYLGNNSQFSQFSFFPFFILSFWSGIDYLANLQKHKISYYTFVIFLLLTGLLVQLSYAKI